MTRSRMQSLLLPLLASLAMLPLAGAYAGPQSGRDAAARQQNERRERSMRERSSLSDAVRRIERNTRGEVLSAERVQFDGRDMHRVKVVDDQGRVRVFMQDPRRRASESDSSVRDDGSVRQPPPRGDDG